MAASKSVTVYWRGN